ncbi:dTDP-4-dehydrorhamnose reductase [Parasedimentitalea huanghaiensis]|uniref:dTDP-4-dehydrorhamnose reductase n=1 Tax=Parasedimentitalea huanghaiensis TaxID=2682100 RepID=A0A6L6WN15_9RHOB|nr:dTDP-4-dehydrorhamnose reductase [Zongyanglinia huanghaiensis]MVO17387.1 dTDP-4-dehydrorhamnose reductase [Zongyanglinia huanghaiensis]
MILVFGKTGQVATELQRQTNVLALGRDSVDLADPSACEAAILAHKPEMVINAAAYTAVDAAEDNQALANTINGDAPGVMAKTSAALDIPFVHISTDYVFDGSGIDPFTPDHPTAPLGVYGASKLRGEELVRAANGTHAILRTSWVFSAHGQNFVKTMRRLGANHPRLTIVADQIGGPTAAHDIAAACLSIAAQLAIDPDKSGTYHFAGGPDVSWADFARAVFAGSDLSPEVVDIPSCDYPTPAKRPANSRLDCQSLAVFDIDRPDWRTALTLVLKELEAQS